MASLVCDPVRVPYVGLTEPHSSCNSQRNEEIGDARRDIWVDQDKKKMLDALGTMAPLSPRIASEIWARNHPSAVDVTLGVFSLADILSEMGHVHPGCVH